jgi:hypothetical protein
VGPIECDSGDEEVVCWQEGWKHFMDIDVATVNPEKDLPRFVYHFAFKREPNIESRERIWNIVLQIRSFGRNMGLI